MEINFGFISRIVCISLLSLPTLSKAQTVYSYGTYTGNGGASQAINWVGFQPVVVLVVPNSASYNGWIATNTMTAGYAKSMAGNAVLVTGKINSLNSNGFTVGSSTDANNNGTKYFFIAFKSGSNIVTGTYTGDGLTPKASAAVSGLAFAPQMLWIMGDSGDANDCAALGNASNTNMGVKWANGNYTGTSSIYVYNSDGFNVGSQLGANTKTYHYVAFKETGTSLEEAVYAGSSADPTTRTLVGSFQPDILLICNNGNLGSGVVVRTASLAGDNTLTSPGSATTAGLVKSITATGFTTGGGVGINWAGTSYSYAAFSGGNTLPVELLSFTAKKEDGKIVVNWSTASEINNDFFTIERSHDGENWEILKETKGAGNSSSLILYSEYDENPFEGVSYYRLKQTDYDGQFKYSQTASVGSANDHALKITAFPNPVNSYMFVEFETQNKSNIDASLYDQNGIRVKQILKQYYDKGSYKVLVYTDDLAAGFYYIRLNTNTEGVATKVSVIH